MAYVVMALYSYAAGRGKGGQGKNTLLRLLARQILPTDGFIVYPSRSALWVFP